MLKLKYMEKKILFEKNLIVVGLSNEFVRFISSRLAEKLNFYYLDVDNLLDYSLMDRIKMNEVCGAKYLDEQEKKVIKSLNDYEKTVMSIKIDTFIANLKFISSDNIKVYASFNKSNLKDVNQLLKPEFETEIVLNELTFNEEDKFLKKNCDIVINCDINNIDACLEELINKFN